jgi:DnaJ-class molecular chaperone
MSENSEPVLETRKCEECQGDGVWDGIKCAVCHGSGKIFKDGTVVLQEGQAFKANAGKLEVAE